ncbi:hypothetical protein CBS63078_10302 [Aspergillus niger]|uniref:Contig An04c0140, genomic contig n=5 Tax=Aspergillus subgen. Circumdati TaxID=2720871 RepID=A2QIK0_ASPNC|nr:uncharacterized protein An04g03800 [Aspergillus niger]XP_025457543.1 uncharacterized protein BO96DRAFT_409779 [Aspergillus niger CBS 101883]XP_026632637.1 hypothetical protein BDQ94DRAFT_7083 [Aspergillus welwitschiae]EHA20624.1 hypothetical protein ASPNIDRAFT_190740 [Aspergillus niger ATCC 1015]RDH20317.1 hypothetical protein M747DRAFT_295897 [Aspergillus niger ATCC 13496]KAI2823024.1 hypothetical protein CBS115989_1734 [Aspergillus niger]KAI2823299.1 hypothetical protein CBS133816_9146 [|eukprot:XP_001401746.1 hypothetical protein ANI_1_696184 [Aspergillus niger CBS 513.88]
MSLFRNCRAATVQFRGFTSSSCLRVGPESPNFVDIPQPIQPDLPSKPRVKGTLPVPRELFPARRKDKPTEAYINAATPLPTKETKLDPNDPNTEYIEWKKRMAEMRRKNLREGLLELHTRKQRTDKTMMQRSLEKQKRRDRILRQPEREDQRLTRNSVIQDMLPKHTAVLPDPDRETRLAESKARLEYQQAVKEAERQDNLQELYMNARNFITTEAQLLAEIERVFPEGENEAWRSDHQEGENIWNLGVPPTVQGIVNETRKSETARWDVIQDRVKQLGEQITGGKL